MNAKQRRESIRRWQRRLGHDLRALQVPLPWRVGPALMAGIGATTTVFQQAHLSAHDLATTEFGQLRAAHAIFNLTAFKSRVPMCSLAPQAHPGAKDKIVMLAARKRLREISLGNRRSKNIVQPATAPQQTYHLSKRGRGL